MKKNGTLPAAVLFDFGGVLVDATERPRGRADVAEEVDALLRREGASLDKGRVERDVRAGWLAYRHWKLAEGRRAHPRETSHREFWEELVAADWPPRSRDVVARHADELAERIDVATKDRPPKADALETLRALTSAGIPCAIVSNALSGQGSRKLVNEYGFEPHLPVQVYSDEAGVRKPNPEIFALAARELGVTLERCWYIGDQIDRDVLGARRAGVGRVLLLPSGSTGTGNDAVAEPDSVISRPSEILALMGLAVAAS